MDASRMHGKKFRFGLVVLVLLLLLNVAAYANSKYMRVFDYREGSLLIWNPSPVSGETVHWEGGMISHYRLTGEEPGFPVYYVHGYGKASWFVNGVFEQSDEGEHYGGKRNGRIIQRFADGRVKETVWEHGIKIE